MASCTYLQRIFAREALVAVAAGKRLDGEMYALVTLEIMIAVEALWALIASERSVVLWVYLGCVMRVHLLHRGVSAVVWHCHAGRHAVH